MLQWLQGYRGGEGRGGDKGPSASSRKCEKTQLEIPETQFDWERPLAIFSCCAMMGSNKN